MQKIDSDGNYPPQSERSLREELTNRFIPALLVVQSALFLLGVIAVSATMRNRQTSELQLSASKTVELYGALARYGDVRYARFIIVSRIGSSGLENFEVYDLKGEQIQESDPTDNYQLPASLLKKAQIEFEKLGRSNQTKYSLLEKDSLGDSILFKYLVVTIDGSSYIIAIRMSLDSVPWLWIFCILCLGVGSSYFMAKYIAGSRIASPVASIEKYAGQVRELNAREEVGFPVPFKEFVPVHTAIQEMVKNIQMQTKQVAFAHISQMLSHDLRGPLGTFERLLSISDNEIPTMKKSIRDALNRLHALVDALRHSESENIIKRSVADLDFHFGMDALQHKASLKKLQLKAKVQRMENVFIDHAKMERAWMNLISNALEAAQNCVIIEAKTEGTDLKISVVDDGPGVSDEFLPKLFQRGATCGKADGTGLGLAYVRQIIRGHGGDVSYRRENGLTIFECRLPNAVVQEGENSLKNQVADSSFGKVQDKKIVALRFRPESLSRSLVATLNSQKSENFQFSCEFEGADVVATNDPDIALDAIEDGKEPLEFSSSLQEAAIVDRLKRRFHLV